jgi:hypothetical protein
MLELLKSNIDLALQWQNKAVLDIVKKQLENALENNLINQSDFDILIQNFII